ncbi:unnamed protein product, partial [Didymodactylos carnosus]
LKDRREQSGYCFHGLVILSYVLVVITFPLSLCFCMKILTKDSVTVAVDAVVYFRIFNAVISITNVEDAAKSTKSLAATTLRNV